MNRKTSSTMSKYGTSESHHTPFPCTDCLINIVTSSSSSAPTSTGAAESSFTPPMGPRSQTHLEHVIILVLISVIIFTLFFFIVFYLFRRYRQRYLKRQSELEEGRMEVAEARAMWPVDETLKEGCLVKSFQLLSPSMPRAPPPAVGGIASHPLYHPGIKRSRTLPHIQAPQYPLSRPAASYPHVINGQTNNLEPLCAYLKSESKPLTSFTTMQTRRPQTPEPIYSKLPLRQSGPTRSNPFLGRQIQTQSVWSSSAASSIAPSSPSIYSPRSPKTIRSRHSLRPAPAPRHSPPAPYSPYQSPASEYMPHKLGMCPLFALDRDDLYSGDLMPESLPINENLLRPRLALETNHPRDDSPTLQPSALPKFRPLDGDCPLAVIEAKTQSIPQVPPSPPTSPLRPPRSPTPPLPRSLDSLRSLALLKSLRPVRLTIDLSANPFEAKLDQSPIEQIERWLDSSTATISAFGSLLADGNLGVSSPNGSSPLAQTLDEEDSSKEEEVTETIPPKQISPIRAMRSSASRKGSKDDIGSAF